MKKLIPSFLFTGFCITIFMIAIGCDKKSSQIPDVSELEKKLVVLNTDSVKSIGTATAIGGGNIISDGGHIVTVRGICWSTQPNPTIANRKTVNTNGIGNFNTKMIGLEANTVYYVRTYATNSDGTFYGNTITFKSLANNPGTVSDADGNIYHTVKIGTQEWLVENLQTTSYRNGDSIPNLIWLVDWEETHKGAYCHYENDPAKDVSGLLYNWYTVVDNRKIAPVGWHIPSHAEWATLIQFLGGYNVAGVKLKETGTANWVAPNANATNSSGFTAKGAGTRNFTGPFAGAKYIASFWGTDAYPDESAIGMVMMDYYNYQANLYTTNERNSGFSVRCIRD